MTKTSDTLLSLVLLERADAQRRDVAHRGRARSCRSGGTTATRDLGVHAWAVAPFFYTSDSPAGHDWLTPLVGHFETYAQSSTTWVFPTFTFNSNTHGWENDLHPLIYVGRNDDSSHTVVAPVFWDFANPNGRTTIGFPVFWRFADAKDDSVTQVAANTVYLQKRVAGRHRLAVPPRPALLVRRGPARATSGTSSSAWPATRTTGPRRRRASSGSRSTGTAQRRPETARRDQAGPGVAHVHVGRRSSRLKPRARCDRQRGQLDVGAAVVSSPSEKRTVLVAASTSPIATSTSDGSAVPALHALPPEAATPSRSSAATSSGPRPAGERDAGHVGTRAGRRRR